MSMSEIISLMKQDIHGDIHKNKLLSMLETKTGVPKLYLTIGAFVVFVLVLMLGYGADILCTLAGFVYPTYASFKAIESTDTTDDTQWLTYWVVFSFFEILETFGDIFLGWIPFYFAIKFFFLLWCYAPYTKGASWIYSTFIRKYMKENEQIIDDTLADASSAVKDIGGELVTDGITMIKKEASTVMEKVIHKQVEASLGVHSEEDKKDQ